MNIDVEKIAAVLVGAVIVYLIFNSQHASDVIGSIGSATSGVLGTLQGRNVTFGTGVSGGPLSGNSNY